ncbi:PAS domain S-box protein [Salinibaculum marinum]|uniref:PAS domain S-box protein n=1 Tax=Salinibaculum marinum TaxID=3131993 RepID=UPI0030CEC4D6
MGDGSLAGERSHLECESGRSIAVETLDAGKKAPDEIPEGVDCAIIDGGASGVDAVPLLERWTAERPAMPVVFLVDEPGSDLATEALSAGAAETLPRRIVAESPELFCERVRSVLDRHHAEESFRHLYDNVAGVVTVHDPDSGELLHANQTLCDLLGYDREEVLSMQVGEFTADVPGYDQERSTNIVSSVAERDDPLEVEWPVTTADGSVRWIESRLKTVRVGGREVVLSTSVDITERRRQERRYERIFDNVNDLVSIHDPWAEEIVDVNEPMAELTGYSRETLLDIDIGGFSVTSEGFTGARAYEIQQRVAANDEAETVEWMIRTAAGETRRLEINLAPATIAGQDRVLALARDVTERHEYERRLERERDRRSVLFENNPDPVLRVKFEGDEPVIREVNPAFEDVFGFPSAEVVGSTVAEAVVPDAEREEHERLSNRVARGESLEKEVPRQTVDGIRQFRFRVIHFSTDPDADDATEAYVWYTDVTERKRREREYEQLFNGVNDSITVHDPETAELLDVNEAFCDLLGYDREEILDMGVEGYSPDDEGYTMEQAREFVQEVVESDEPQQTEWVVETSDGEKRWLEVKGTTVELGGELRYVSIDRDITERRRREREYEQIFNGVQGGITINDPETGEIVAVNDSMCGLLGYDREEILELGIEGISAAEQGFTPDRARELVDEVLETGEPRQFEWALETSDGETKWLDVRGTVAEIGGERRYLSLTRDVTERRRREREYEQIFNMAGDGIVIHDPESGEVVDANEQVAELLGYDREAFLDRPLAEFQATAEGASGKQAREMIRESVREGGREFEWPLETADGETVWVRARHEIGEIEGEQRIVALLHDITERRRREREYEQIFNGVTDAITVHDPETGEVLDLNETMCELTGYDREELLSEGQDVLNVAEEGYSTEQARDIVREVMETGEPRTLEWLIERKDGQRRWVEVNATPATLNGEDRYLALMRDVTAQRRTERRLGEILDRIDEAIFMTRAQEITDASQSPDYVSSGYEDIWGQSLADIREHYRDGFFGTLHPDDEGEYRPFVDRIVRDIDDDSAADSYSHEYRIERPDGEVRWVQSDYYPTTWEGGLPRIVIVSRDVTERKARERRMASFDDATDDLATADTPAEATRTAVEAATEMLDLPAVGAFLYDDDDGVLRPEVLAGPIPGAVSADPVGPGDGPLWESFATGTIVAPDGGNREGGFPGADDAAPAALADLEAWRALALGNHGVLLVGSPDSSLAPETIQASHMLAATLEAALNHLKGQQRLAAQEEQLRTQTERAERLDRIARLTQQVEAAITDATDAREVERAVCERLASSGPYDLAWIGGLEVGTDRLTARAVVGGSNQYVASMDLSTTDDSADPHPAVAAWRTDEVRVADSLVGDGLADDWRQHGLAEGYQSLCAVPLSYDGITHGVLTVGTDSPNAFGDREQDVLAQLGTSIANALAAIERRRALESDETVELEFRGAGDSLPFARAADAADCRVRHERTVARQDGPVSVYFSFEGDAPDTAGEIAERTLPGSVDVVADESSATLVEVRTDDWFGSPLAEYGGVLRDAWATPEETTIAVEVPQQADVRSFVDRLQVVAPSVELVARRQHRTRDRTPAELSEQVRTELTDRQFEVLQTALSAGYFEWPRDNDGSDVAERLDITQPTLNKHLRLAEKKIFSLLFDDDT